MSLDLLLLVLSNWRWQLMTLLVAAICAAYSLAAIRAAQSREHWITRGLAVCGLLALLLPPRAHEPLMFFLLMLPILGTLTAWQTWRRAPAPNGAPHQPFQFSLRNLLCWAWPLLAPCSDSPWRRYGMGPIWNGCDFLLPPY
jgi:hypothetical protein